MTDVRIATGAEQPINSDGFVSTVTGSEGDLVGLNDDGEIVAADAASGTQVAAFGVLATPVDDHSNYPSADQFEFAAKLAESNRADINAGKVGLVRYGVELTNEDSDWGFTENDPVYLDTGGGYTQTAPSGVDELVQRVGVAHEEEAITLDIQQDYSRIDYNSGDATFSGDASATAFDIAHGLSSTPTVYEVQPTSSEAAKEHYVSGVDDTNITVTFASAPADASDNVTFNWSAEE